MKRWTRWEDYVALAAGLLTVVAALTWTSAAGSALALMLIFGVLLIVTGILNLSMPSTPWLEYAQFVIGVLLFLSPWLGAYAMSAMQFNASASWTSWILGVIAAAVTVAAFKPVQSARHQRMAAQH